MGSVGSLQCQMIPCFSLYLFSRSIGDPQIHSLSINCRVLICYTSHFQRSSPFFVYFGFLSLQISSVSNFCPDKRGRLWLLIQAHLFSCVVGREGHCKHTPLACVGSDHSEWTTPVWPQPKVVCTFWVHNGQAPECSARALSQVGPAFGALPRSKPLRFLGAAQGHRPKWAVSCVPFPGPSSSGDQVLDQCTVPGGPCVLCTSLVTAT